MLAVRNPFARESHEILPKPTRKPLQPRNSNVLNSTLAKLKSVVTRDDALKPATQARGTAVKDKPKASEEMRERDLNKENIPVMLEGLDSSLGAELIEMRKRVERLKLDKDETEKKLKERDALFEVWKENIKRRGEEQRKLEFEADRVFGINGIRALKRNSPVRSLREREAPLSVLKPILKWVEDDMEESVGENSNGSPDKRSDGYSGDFAAITEMNSVSAESRC